MNCTYCAESVSWFRRMLSRQPACPYCRLPLIRKDRESKAELVSAEAFLELDRSDSRAELFYPLGGITATVVLSLIPSFGILTAMVLPPVQMWFAERSVSRMRERLSFYHGLTYDIFSGFFVVMLIGVQGTVGAMLGPLAVVVNSPLFLLYWFANKRFARFHLARVADSAPIHWLEKTLLVGFAVALFAPAVILTGALLAYSGFSDADSGVGLGVLLGIMSASAVTSMDLFMLPLWGGIALLAFGLIDAPEGLDWAGSWWLLLIVTTGLGIEVVLDNALDRRRSFSRSTWPTIQSVLSPFTILAVFLILGREASPMEMAFGLPGSILASSILRFGGTEPLKRLPGLLGGSLAQRKALLLTAPWRVAGTLLVAYLALEHQTIAAAAIGSAVTICLGLIVVSLIMRRLTRWRGRTKCSCGYPFIKSARICPSCHLPTIVTRLKDCPSDVRYVAIQIATAFAWSDGELSSEEARMLEKVFQASGLEPERIEGLSDHLANGIVLEQIDFGQIPADQQNLLRDFARDVVMVDGKLNPAEKTLWKRLLQALDEKVGRTALPKPITPALETS